MSFDFSTLVTDRLQSDVDERNAKGTYNAADLNRVTAAMEALDEIFRAYGYHSGYAPIIVADRRGQSGRLPDGYTEVEYIHSDGNQYIDTGVKPNQNTRIEMTSSFVDSTPQYSALFGSRTGNENQFWAYWVPGSNRFQARYGAESLTITSTLQDVDIFDFDKNTCTINGASDEATPTEFQSFYSAFLFSVNSSGSVQYPSSIRLYSCKIYDNGTKIRDFVPCKNPSEAVGLYDTVGKQFYGNGGTGAFTAGPDVPQPEPEPILDPQTWYEQDIPLRSQMAQYLANLAALRGVLAQVEAEPPTPESMKLLTYVEANDIEQILLNIEAVLTTIGKSFLRAGMTWAVAGGPKIFARNGGTA